MERHKHDAAHRQPGGDGSEITASGIRQDPEEARLGQHGDPEGDHVHVEGRELLTAQIGGKALHLTHGALHVHLLVGLVEGVGNRGIQVAGKKIPKVLVILHLPVDLVDGDVRIHVAGKDGVEVNEAIQLLLDLLQGAVSLVKAVGMAAAGVQIILGQLGKLGGELLNGAFLVVVGGEGFGDDFTENLVLIIQILSDDLAVHFGQRVIRNGHLDGGHKQGKQHQRSQNGAENPCRDIFTVRCFLHGETSVFSLKSGCPSASAG